MISLKNDYYDIAYNDLLYLEDNYYKMNYNPMVVQIQQVTEKMLKYLEKPSGDSKSKKMKV